MSFTDTSHRIDAVFRRAVQGRYSVENLLDGVTVQSEIIVQSIDEIADIGGEHDSFIVPSGASCICSEPDIADSGGRIAKDKLGPIRAGIVDDKNFIGPARLIQEIVQGIP